MRRAILVLVVLIAAAIAFEPLIHTHPLTQTAPVPCAVCVASIGRITPHVVAAFSPLAAVAHVVPYIITTPLGNERSAVPSRAPPAV